MGKLHRTLMSLVVIVGLMATTVATSMAQDGDVGTITVGSKDFTEQIILGEMVAILLEDAGYDVERQLNLGGTAVVHQALVSGEVDIYVEYTGTGLLAILDMELPGASATPDANAAASPVAGSGEDAVYDIVRDEYADQFDLVWLDPWGFNNTYTLAMRPEQAEELGVSTISDLEGVSEDLTFGATQEFLVRDDGLPGLTEAYGLEFGDAVGLDPGLVYQAVDSEEVDIISAFATDGRISELGLVTLEDDRGFFPPYFAAPVVRQELLDAAPEIADILNQLGSTIDDATMSGLNLQVDSGGMEAEDVARTYLEEQGLLSNS